MDRLALDIRQQMETLQLPMEVIDNFLEMLRKTLTVEDSYVSLDSLSAPETSLLLNTAYDPARVNNLSESGMKLLDRVAVIKLNGGRSTTMGGEVPKGILIAKNGRSYLDIIAGQINAIQKHWGVEVPLFLMNSFFTHEPTIRVISRLDIPVRTFTQSQVPRLVSDTLAPLRTGTDEDWVPPGHGDVYMSLRLSGLLEEMIAEGRRWAFISNLDNLAACLEPWILGLIESEGIEFLMEVTERTEEDRKGGTLVVREGRLDLLEIAQVSPEERDRFMDINRFRVFNTNNIWVDLEALSRALDERVLKLPIIQNIKHIAGTKVIQLETAMGSAIGSFSSAKGLLVTRDRFFPTKTVEDLFLLHTDVCILDSMDRLQRNPNRPQGLPSRPRVVFGSDFLDSPLKIQSCFEDPSSVSLVRAESLEVQGPVYFESDVKIVGKVKVQGYPGHTYRVKRGTTLRDAVYSSQPESGL